MMVKKSSVLLLFPAMVSLVSCVKEDEELQRQIIELRSTVENKNKTVEQLQSQVASLQSQSQRASSNPSSVSSEELNKAKARIAELEQRLAAASANPAAPTQVTKLDMEAMAEKLEVDLTLKAKQLRALVQKQAPSSRIDEISLKSIDFPPQLVTPFTSAITFTVTVGNGAPLRLMFPVTADLGGTWTLPTPDEVQKAYKAAQEQPQGLASGGVQPAAPQASPSQGQVPQASGGGGARMTQRADGVFVFDWGDGAGAGAAQARPQQASPQPPPAAGSPQTVNNFVPPGQGGTQPQPAAPQAPRPPAAAPQAPAAPPPVMPIVGDRVIRFND